MKKDIACITYSFIIFFCLLAVIVLSMKNRTFLSLRLSSNQSQLFTMMLNDNKSHAKVSSCAPIKMAAHEIKVYKLSSNAAYHYEYRYELNKQNASSNESRLILLLNGLGGYCDNWWVLSVGESILSHMRSSGFSFLTVCTSRRRYDIETPIKNNSDVYWIYKTLQIWMNEIYYPRFHHYPRLYLFGVSLGARLTSLLCRVLPVQAQILYLSPGYRPAIMLHSDYTKDMQNRLKADFTFANWFYFDYCSKTHVDKNKQCPFYHGNKNYFNSIPPSYFIHVINDGKWRLTDFTSIIRDIRNNAAKLGDTFLTHNHTMKLHVLLPVNLTANYMKENYRRWSCKPWSSYFFYQHLTNSSYNTKNKKLRTCICTSTNFLYFKRHPNITQTWSKAKQDGYADYVKDVKQFRRDLCKTTCGDILASHAVTSRHIKETLLWLNDMDHYRSLYKIDEFIRRPLRLWMYNKSELVQNITYLHYQSPLNSSCDRHYHANQMYSSEYFLNDYFHYLEKSYPSSRHNLIWTNDPLLADYYIIPHDYICIAVDYRRRLLTQSAYTSFFRHLNQNYFLPLLTNVRTRFPYWNMSLGTNHIISFTHGKTMAIIQDDQIVDTLKHVIQLGFTGLRQDLLLANSSSLYVYRNITPIYRHNYDIIIPPFNRLQSIDNRSPFTNSSLNQWYQMKKSLLFFAGTLNHSQSMKPVRERFALLIKEAVGKGKRYENEIIIDKKRFKTIVFIDGHLSSVDYIESIRSSIFSLCLEGFSPWSPRIYESVNLGTIPLILAESIVLPFERFIDWRSFSTKINVNNIEDLFDLITKIDSFEDYAKEKLLNATKYFHAFRWPYSPINQYSDRHVFLPEEDMNGTTKNVFHYLSLELRCRRLEQFYGLNFNSLSLKSLHAKEQTCKRHSTICPCYEQNRSLALEQYI